MAYIRILFMVMVFGFACAGASFAEENKDESKSKAEGKVEAVEVYKGKEPKDKAMTYRLEGYRSQKKGDLDNAIVYYKKATEEDSGYACPYNDMGIVYEEKGYFSAAEKSYLKAIELDPNYTAPFSNLACLYENKGDLEKSIFYWKKRIDLAKESDSEWVAKAREKVQELEKRKNIKGESVVVREKAAKKPNLYNKKRAVEKVASRSTKADLEHQLAQRYFESGLEFYNQREYDKALGAFKMAQTYDGSNQEASKYIIKINRIKQSLDASGVPGVSEYDGVVSKEDMALAKDHFKMGLDYHASGDYERAFSNFTIAMTYNPYDETIKRYVDDSRVKIEEAKIKKRKLREEERNKAVTEMSQPTDVRKEMVKQKEDIVNKGFIVTTEDMSVEKFMADGKDLFAKARYDDAIYIWQQAVMLDVQGIYRNELEDLINQAKVKASKKTGQEFKKISEVVEEDELANVSKTGIPSEAGSAAWDFKKKEYKGKNSEMISQDKKMILEKLNERYTLNFQDASLKGVVDLLTELTGLNIVIDTKEIKKEDMDKSNITFKVKEMPLIEILKSVLRFTDYDYLIENNMIWITSKDKIRKEDMVLVVYDVQDLVGKVFDFPAEELGENTMGARGRSGATAASSPTSNGNYNIAGVTGTSNS